MSIRILLVDDHAIVRAGYRVLLGKQLDMTVVAEAADSAEAYQAYKSHQPDVTITDLSLPGSSGLDLLARIKQRNHQAKLLVFSMHQNPTLAQQAIRAGALGYVTKSSQPEALLHAIQEVYAGRHCLSADIAHALAIAQLGNEQQALQDLTVREFEILSLLLTGKSPEKIAGTLNISPKTVNNSHYLIKRKLGVANDIELMRLAIRVDALDLLNG